MTTFSRRSLLGSLAALGAATFFPQAPLARSHERGEANAAVALSILDTPEPILSGATAANLQLAVDYYQRLAATDAWEAPTRATFKLALGKEGRAVSALNRYLIALQDMPAGERVSRAFDESTDLALRKFQVRHGILPSGKVDEPTFYALAVSPAERLVQLQLNALRVGMLAPAFKERYLLINIPAASLETVEGGAVLTRHTAVVGKVDRQTPILSSKVHQVKFNPYWTVPKSIIEKDLVRYMHEDPQYLANFRIRVFDGKGNEVAPEALDWSSATDPLRYTFRQDPGGENSLGRCKIDFYNPHDVYLHDTPAKELFSQNDRFYSSGCVRAQNIDVIAAWLLADNGGWDLPAVQAMFAVDENVNVPLKFQMPIHTTYVTAWVNALGTVSFRDDIYGYDAAGRVDFS